MPRAASRSSRKPAAAGCSHSDASAERLIRDSEAYRATLPAVPFYIHDGDTFRPGFSLIRTLDRMAAQCLFSTPPRGMAHYLGEYYFLRALSTHRWRTQDIGHAKVLIVPLLLSIELRNICPWYNSSADRAALFSQRAWRDRRSDHLLLALDYVVSGRWGAER